jgi:hypothetical protein
MKIKSVEFSNRLDSGIECYKGRRPIGLYRWDMDYLIDVVDIASDDTREYPAKGNSDYLALKRLAIDSRRNTNGGRIKVCPTD